MLRNLNEIYLHDIEDLLFRTLPQQRTTANRGQEYYTGEGIGVNEFPSNTKTQSLHTDIKLKKA